MTIQKVAKDDALQSRIEAIFTEYETANGVAFDHTPFCFTATQDGLFQGAVAGYTCFCEVFVDELVVEPACRGRGVGSALMRAVEAHFADTGLHNINLYTYGFQAAAFYEKLGYTLEFVRRDPADPRLDKYYFSKLL